MEIVDLHYLVPRAVLTILITGARQRLSGQGEGLEEIKKSKNVTLLLIGIAISQKLHLVARNVTRIQSIDVKDFLKLSNLILQV